MATNDKRSYSEEEVGKLISRAIARQEADRLQKKHHEGGLSLEEVQQVARDAGIDPEYIVLAASDLERGDPPVEKSGFLGAPVTILRERLVPGALDDDQIARMVGEIRSTLAGQHILQGQFSTIGRSFEWSTPVMGSTRSILVRGVPEGDHTRLIYRERNDAILVLFHIWWTILAPMGTLFAIIPGVPWLVSIIMLLLSALSFFGGRAGAGAVVRKRIQDVDHLMDTLERIGQHVETDSPEAQREVASARRAEPRLEPPEPDPLMEHAPQKKRATRRS